MSELTIRGPGGSWIGICDSEWKIMQDDGTWLPIDPGNDLRVRHGSNDYWLQINCDEETGYCPPEALAECWPGYSGNFDSSEFKTGGATGYMICDCDGLNCKTYTGHGPDYDRAGGRFQSTAPLIEETIAYSLPTTLSGSEAEVTEMLVYAGPRSGHVEVSLLELDEAVRVRVYHDCVLLSDSDVHGTVSNFFYTTEPPGETVDDCGNPIPVNQFLTVRVDAPAHVRWSVKIGEVNIEQQTSFAKPAACFGTFGPQLPCRVNDDGYLLRQDVTTYEMVHYVPGSGRVDIDLTVNGIEPVSFQAYYGANLIGEIITDNAKGKSQVAKTLSFQHNVVGGDNFIIIRYTAKRQYTSWYYSIYCSDMRGSRVNKMECMGVPDPVPYDVLCQPLNNTLDPNHAIVSRGAHQADIFYDYTNKEKGDIVIEYFADDPVQFQFWQGNYPNETLIAGTPTTVQGHDRFYFRYEPEYGTSIHVRVIGPCCPDWAFTMSCPVPAPVLDIFDAEIVRGKAGVTKTLCFDVKLRNKTPHRVKFNWLTSPITALSSVSGNCMVTEGISDTPYCNIAATGGAREALASNDANLGYAATRICSDLHETNCAPGGRYFVLETEIDLASTGTYTIRAAADDGMTMYLDCIQKFKSTVASAGVQAATFTAAAGRQTLSVMYTNSKECTPAWVKFVILDSTGAVVFRSNVTTHTWRSKSGIKTVEPPTDRFVYGADYNKVQGTAYIEPCEESTRICVPICGTDMMGPSVTFNVILKDLEWADPGDLVAVGTIHNENFYECDQETELVVLDGGPDTRVARNARMMYVNKPTVNPSSAYVIDTEITLATSGLYTMYLFGRDIMEVYVDCQRVAALSNPSAAVKVRVPMNAGLRQFHINYSVNAGNARRQGFVTMAIVDSLNRVVYASNAADWRGRITNEGTEPNCRQYGDKCDVLTNSISLQGNVGDASDNYTLGNGSQRVRSNLHPDAKPADGIVHTIQWRPLLPAGDYTMTWTASIAGSVWVDCRLRDTKSTAWNVPKTFTFSVPDGGTRTVLSMAYQAGAAMGSAWGIWVVKNMAGQVVQVSGPDLPRAGSALGTQVYQSGGSRLYSNWVAMWGCLGVHPGSSYNGKGAGPHYGYWSAELDYDIPKDDTYYISASADDGVSVYVGCQGASRFYMPKGPTKIHVRVYNYKSKDETWFTMQLRSATTGALIYQADAPGWRYRMGDLNFSGFG